RLQTDEPTLHSQTTLTCDTTNTHLHSSPTRRSSDLNPSSSVKRSRDQSTESPIAFIWEVMVLPYSSFHSQTLSMNSSRSYSQRDLPSGFFRRASTLVCVPMPAWS